MQVNETKSEGLKREFKFSVPSAEIEENVTSRLKELAQTVQLPGFRPGKVPVGVIRTKYKASVMGEVLEKTVNEASYKVISESKLRPVAQPDIKVDKFEEGSDLECTMAFEVMPEIESVDVSKIKIERLVAEVDEADVEKSLGRLASCNKTSKKVSANRKAKTGDTVIIDFLGKVDGEPFAGGQAAAYSLELGSGSFIPGFEEQLVGAKTGDHVEVKVAFPEAYGGSDLAGKDAVFEVDIKELRESEQATINDELAKAVGLESLDELKGKLRDEHRKGFDEQSRRLLKRSLLDALSKDHVFDTPESMVEGELERIWAQFEEHRKSSPESFEGEDADKSDEDHKAEFRIIAQRRVCLGLLLGEIGRANNVQVSPEEINDAIIKEASRYPGQEQAVSEYYEKNPDAQEMLSASLHEDKVVDFIIDKAKVTDKKVSVEELMKDPEDTLQPDVKTKAKKKTKPKEKAAKKPATSKKAEKKE